MPSVFPANIKAESVKQILDALLFLELEMLIHFLQRCGISRFPCLRLLNHPQRNMAIPVRVSIQILLVAARTPCHAARVLCHASKSSEYAKSRPFYATSGFSFIRFSRRSQLRIVDHLHLSIGEIERFHVLHLFDLCVNHRFKRHRVEPDSVLAENLLRIRQLLVAIACAV